jgi:acetyl esterase/lipase
MRLSYALLKLALLCALYLPRLHGFGVEFPPISPRGIRESATLLSAAKTPSSVDSKNLRTFDKWEELDGNFVLRPSIDQGPPRALLHFLGGAIVGAAPHVSYRYLLERLAAEGYLIVATPYNLSFDHLSTCDAILSRFERIAGTLALTYGPLPVVGVGHSCGALLQLLITSLFPDTPRAACALISYNNKPVQEAVPVFEEIVAPFFTFVAARNDTNRRNGGEVISLGLELAKLGVTGKLPSDELLTKAMKIALFPPMMDTMMQDKDIKVPNALRESYEALIGPPTSALAAAGLAPIVFDLLETLEQIPQLIDEVADGARDFNPTPDEVSAVARRAYRARRTLILRYTEDPLDESEKIEELVQAAGQVIRMKRPMINIDIQRRDLPGGHAAPLLAPPLELATRAEDLLGAAAAKEQLQYLQADLTVQELTKWLEESDL